MFELLHNSAHFTYIMLKILQDRLQQCVIWGLPDLQAGFRKGRGTRDQIVNIGWIIEKAREFQKDTYFCFNNSPQAFDYVDHNKLENSTRNGNTRPPLLSLEKPVCRQVAKKQRLELDMEQQTDSRLGKEHVKPVYCHPAYLSCI